VPGDTRTVYPNGGQSRQILNDAEDDLREWKLDVDQLLNNVGSGREQQGGSDERFASTNTSPVLISREQTQQTQEQQRTPRGGSGSGSNESGGDTVNAQQQKVPAVGV